MAGDIPRAFTWPLKLAQGSGSPTAGSPRGLPSWRSKHSHPAAADATAAAALSGWARYAGSRAIGLATAALYVAALLCLAVLYSADKPRPGPPGIDGGGLAAAPAGPLGGRRLALETAAGAAAAANALWPSSSSLASQQLARVEYRDAGNVVELIDALNISQWNELPLYHPNPLPSMMTNAAQQAPGSSISSKQQQASSSGSSGGSGSGSSSLFPAQCPGSDIRLFIGITSRCCTAAAQAKRDAIRRTWVQHARQHLPGVTIRFVLAQPSTDADMHAALELLKGEIHHADIIIVPGKDVYRNLPSKTLQLLKYALSSDCKYTHVAKVDDDVHVRPQMLLDVIHSGQYNFSVHGIYDGSGAFDGQPAPHYQSPWMRGMYVGQLDSQQEGGIWPGWTPNRDPKSKWYLAEEDLPDELAPLGVRWASGWGYLLSRDLAEYITNTALMYAAIPDKKPGWWGRMPWEDILVGAMLSDVAAVSHHDGFKAAWEDCDSGTVLKHLDADAPSLQEGLYVQERSGLWAKRSVVCSSGVFLPNNHSDWRRWRNSLPDNQLGGFM